MTSRCRSPTSSGPTSTSPTPSRSSWSSRPWREHCRPLPTSPMSPSRARKAKMSKRKLAEYEKLGILVYLHQYIEKGYLPEALLNYLARLGWSFDGTQEIFTRAELIEKFSLDRVNSSPASHDQDKLFWIEGEWMKTVPAGAEGPGRAPVPEGRGTGRRAALGSGPDADRGRDRGAGRPAQGLLRHPQAGPVLLHRSARLRPRRREETAAQGGRRRPCSAELDAVLAEVEPFDLATLEKAVHDYAEQTGRKMGDVVNPLRVAVTGQGVGPGPLRLPGILGRATCRAGSGRRWRCCSKPESTQP